MEYDLGQYRVCGPHNNCDHDGMVMEIKPVQIDGKKITTNTPDKWYWCNGKAWDGKERVWHSCGSSSIKIRKRISNLKATLLDFGSIQQPNIQDYGCEGCGVKAGNDCRTNKSHPRKSKQFDADNKSYKIYTELSNELLDNQKALSNIEAYSK